MLFGTGHLIWKFYFQNFNLYSSDNFFLSVSQKMLIGFVAIVAVVSLLVTKGNSLNVVAVIALLVWPHVKKREMITPVPKCSFEISNVLATIGVFLLLFLYYYFVASPTGDMVYYSKVSISIYESGVESIFSVFNDYKHPQGLVLYHYGELWFTGLISLLFRTESLENLLFVTYPLFHGLTVLALMGLVSKQGFSTIKSFLISFSVLYGTTLIEYQIGILSALERDTWFYAIPYFSSSKLLIIYPFVLVAFSFFRKSTVDFLVLISLCIVFYTPTAISIMGGTLGLLLFVWIQERNIKSVLIRTMEHSVPFVVFVSVMAMSAAIGDKSASVKWTNLVYPIATYLDEFWNFFLVFLKYLFRPIVMYPTVFLGLVLMLVKGKFKAHKRVVLFIFFGFLAAAMFIALFGRTMEDSTQILSNVLPMFMVLLATICFEQFKKWYLILLVMLVPLGLLNFIYVGSSENRAKGKFHLELYNFAEKKGRFKWAYVSSKYWSSWNINQNIYTHPILKSNESIMPLEIGPMFDTKEGQLIYCKRAANRNSPMVPFIENNDCSVQNILLFLEQEEIQFVYLEDQKKVPKEFIANFTPILVEDDEGLWQKK